MAFVTGTAGALRLRRVQCVNEDTNFNGVLDSGDNNQNMDGMLGRDSRPRSRSTTMA